MSTDAGIGALVAILMVIGLIGTVVPVMPGLLVIWGGALAYGLLVEFGRVGWVAFSVITLLLVAGTLASYVLPHRSGAAGGASKTSLRLGLALGILGFFVIPVIGLPIGAVAGVMVGEYQRLGDWGAAWATTKRVLIGFGYGALAEIAAGIAMVGTWVGWVVLRA